MNLIESEVSNIAQYVENEQSKIFRTGQYSMISELLYGLELTNNRFDATFTFLDDDKKKTKILLNGISRNEYYENTEFKILESFVPEIEKPKDIKQDYLWFSPIKTTAGVYIKFESYPSLEEMEKFGESVLNYINENNCKQIVIDLRNNGGGDFFIGTLLAYYLKSGR